MRACEAVHAAGFDPIPHLPVRLLESHEDLSQFVREARDVDVKELLLISGDYAEARGPFGNVADVLCAIDLRSRGIERISIGGHPEGHTKMALEEIRRAELQKDQLAQQLRLKATFVTQFFFESAPFLQWATGLRSARATSDIRAGLAGPAEITTLVRYALRCGGGPSLKALGSRPGAFAKLLRARARAFAHTAGGNRCRSSAELSGYPPVLLRWLFAHLPPAAPSRSR